MNSWQGYADAGLDQTSDSGKRDIKRKKEKQTTEMRNRIAVGDKVVTIGGFIGRVVKTKEDSLVIAVGADKTKLEIMRWGISSITEEGAKTKGSKAIDLEEDDEEESKPARPKRMRRRGGAEEKAEEAKDAAAEKAAEAKEAVAEKAKEAAADVEAAAEDAAEKAE